MRKVTRGLLVTVMLALAPMPGAAQSDSARAAECSTYARNRSESESSTGRGALGGAMRGGMGGALFGAIIGGRRGAGRGAALGAGLGAMGGGVRASEDREGRYQYYFDGCMRG
jgi:hypothetical protein